MIGWEICILNKRMLLLFCCLLGGVGALSDGQRAAALVSYDGEGCATGKVTTRQDCSTDLPCTIELSSSAMPVGNDWNTKTPNHDQNRYLAIFGFGVTQSAILTVQPADKPWVLFISPGDSLRTLTVTIEDGATLDRIVYNGYGYSGTVLQTPISKPTGHATVPVSSVPYTVRSNADIRNFAENFTGLKYDAQYSVPSGYSVKWLKVRAICPANGSWTKYLCDFGETQQASECNMFCKGDCNKTQVSIQSTLPANVCRVKGNNSEQLVCETVAKPTNNPSNNPGNTPSNAPGDTPSASSATPFPHSSIWLFAMSFFGQWVFGRC